MNNKKGFTLVEIAIVLAIVSFLMTNMVLFLGNMTDIYREKQNREKIKIVKNAIDNYFAKNQRLPCPSNPFLPFDDSSFGKANVEPSYDNECVLTFSRDKTVGSKEPPMTFQASVPMSEMTSLAFGDYLLFGGIPVRDLGLSPEMAFDVHGNYFTYSLLYSMTIKNKKKIRVDSGLFKSSAGSTRSDLSVSYGNLRAKHTISGEKNSFGVILSNQTANPSYHLPAKQTPLAVYDSNGTTIDGTEGNVAYFLISHGKNGYGSWKKNGQINDLKKDSSGNTITTGENNNSYKLLEDNCTSNCSIVLSTVSDGMGGFISSGLTFTPQIGLGNDSDDIVVYETLDGLISNAETKKSVYCHASTIPGCLTYVLSNGTFAYKQSSIFNQYAYVPYGGQLTVHNVAPVAPSGSTPAKINCGIATAKTYTCDGMGNWY